MIRLNPQVTFLVTVTARDASGKVIGIRRVRVNDVKAAFKLNFLTFVEGGGYTAQATCARKIQIRDTVLSWNSTAEIASLKAGTGDGSVNYFTKVKVFENETPNTYNIDELALMDYVESEWAVASIAPIAFPPGGMITVEYRGTIADGSDGTHPAVMTSYIKNELARAMGQDKDSEVLACGMFQGGTIKLYYDYGGGPQTPIEKTCFVIDSLSPTDTTYGFKLFEATGFQKTGHNPATPTKVVLIPTDGNEAHAYAEQTASLGGPFDLDAGIDISFEAQVNEGGAGGPSSGTADINAVSLCDLQDTGSGTAGNPDEIDCISLGKINDTGTIGSPVDIACISLGKINDSGDVITSDLIECISLGKINDSADVGEVIACISLGKINDSSDYSLGGAFEQTESEKQMPTDTPVEEDDLPSEWH